MVPICLVAAGRKAHWTVEHAVPLVATLLDMALQRTGIEWLEQFEAAEKFAGYRHDSTPIVEFSAILMISLDFRYQDLADERSTHIRC